MSRFVIIGTKDSEGLVLVDIKEGTVTPIDKEALDPSIAMVRQAGATTFRGVDVAIAVEKQEDAVGRFFFDGGSVR